MRVWEQNLAIRRQSCEFRLYNKRQAHSDWIDKRKKETPHNLTKNEWEFRCGQNLMRLQNDIRRELDEIRYVKDLGRIGPIVADSIAVSPRGSQHSVSLFDLIERVMNDYEDAGDDAQSKLHTVRFYATMKGLDLALNIIKNPREFMTTEEQEAYDRIEQDEHEREIRAERFRTPVEPVKSFKTTSAVKNHGNKNVNKSKGSKIPGQPAKQRSLKIVNGKAVWTDD